MIKNLICLENDKASVIRLKSDGLEFIKKDGEIDFPITIDFWDWWKRIVAYVEEDPVDICFVYDKKYDLLEEKEILKNNILNTEDSSWKIEHIKSYFWELKPTYINLVVVGLDENEYALSGDKDGVSRRFHTNLKFNVVKNIIKECEEMDESQLNEDVKNIEEENYSEFAKYFIDLIRRERG